MSLREAMKYELSKAKLPPRMMPHDVRDPDPEDDPDKNQRSGV